MIGTILMKKQLTSFSNTFSSWQMKCFWRLDDFCGSISSFINRGTYHWKKSLQTCSFVKLPNTRLMSWGWLFQLFWRLNGSWYCGNISYSMQCQYVCFQKGPILEWAVSSVLHSEWRHFLFHSPTPKHPMSPVHLKIGSAKDLFARGGWAAGEMGGWRARKPARWEDGELGRRRERGRPARWRGREFNELLSSARMWQKFVTLKTIKEYKL
jgi:hypothetical protein